MKKHSPDDHPWWHERPTKAAPLSSTGFQALEQSRSAEKMVWPKATLVVSLMFALVLSLISMVLR
ncbi:MULTISPECIES: hypothetical protein [unclassified Variovorax]|uniref:hypothetical protein n=1 Tax=unclassified Variovorax TaxID=663243 RepID=UPI001BD422EA|nr:MULTISPECIES: hypothetical protein [unclassified Variovorax]